MSTGTPSDPPSAGDPAAQDSSPEDPRQFGPYLLLKELGRGAQGVVYLAEDATLHRKVALKVLSNAAVQSAATRERFRREATLTSKFEHPGICGVHDMGEVDGVPYIAMQYVRGTTLASHVEKARESAPAGGDKSRGSDTITITGSRGEGGLEDVLRLVERAARALHVAHEAGLVHRDIKPANIMVTPDGYPVLLDFGLARDLDAEGEALTQSGQIMGTPAYLAPEQIVAARGKVDRRTDVYALGVTLYECLTLQRPFEASSWDQLFHEILDGTTRNPAKLNPRIPQDLRTIIEVAMDRDPAQRYATADALAEDLRRVRSFEPISAKAAGPIARTIKWSRRNPGKAVSAAAASLFVFTWLGFFALRFVQRSRDLHAHLRAANDALVAANYKQAAIEVAQAQELDPESPQVRELVVRVERGEADAKREADRRADFANAAEALEEGRAHGVRYLELRAAIDAQSAEILRMSSAVFGSGVHESARAEFAQLQVARRGQERDAESVLQLQFEALNRALRLEDRWGGASAATQDALASYYAERWRDALRGNDPARAAAMRAAAERYDTPGVHRAEFLGTGTLAVTLVPQAAEAFLFRYEEYDTLRASDVIPRLVPVPTAGRGRVRDGVWPAAFAPGDPCLVVRAVEPDSPAARAGFAPGDLVLRLGPAPAANSVLVRAVAPESALARVHVPALARVARVDGFEITNLFDWTMRTARKDTPKDADAAPAPRVAFDGAPGEVACAADEMPVASALELVHQGASAPVELTCLARGELRTLALPAGVRAGLDCDVTAYPLVLATANRVASGAVIDVDPGSYLLCVRAPGCEDQRFPFVVARRAAATVRVELLPSGTTPPGFVHIPAGPAVIGGDPDAFRPRAASTVDVPAFFIARKELTNREWFEFVNDPEIRAKIDARAPNQHGYLPEDDRVFAKRAAEDAPWTFDVYTGTTEDTPVLGLAWTDVREYLAWRNTRAEKNGEAWRYDLPSVAEWEKAARGVDARTFPWGHRFDPSLTVCLVRQQGFLLDAPGGYEPRDESPFGVLDLAGSREEWLRDPVERAESPQYRKRGGHWSTAVEAVFHCASDAFASQDRFASSQGVRLVARRP